MAGAAATPPLDAKATGGGGLLFEKGGAAGGLFDKASTPLPPSMPTSSGKSKAGHHHHHHHRPGVHSRPPSTVGSTIAGSSTVLSTNRSSIPEQSSLLASPLPSASIGPRGGGGAGRPRPIEQLVPLPLPLAGAGYNDPQAAPTMKDVGLHLDASTGYGAQSPRPQLELTVTLKLPTLKQLWQGWLFGKNENTSPKGVDDTSRRHERGLLLPLLGFLS